MNSHLFLFAMLVGATRGLTIPPTTTPSGTTFPPTTPSGTTFPPTTSSGTTFPPTTPSGTSFPPTTPSGTTFPPTNPSGTSFPPTTHSGTTFPPTTHSGTSFPPTTHSGTTFPPTTPSGTTVPPTTTPSGTTIPPTTTASGTTIPPTTTASGTTIPPTTTASGTTVPPTMTPPSTLNPTPCVARDAVIEAEVNLDNPDDLQYKISEERNQELLTALEEEGIGGNGSALQERNAEFAPPPNATIMVGDRIHSTCINTHCPFSWRLLEILRYYGPCGLEVCTPLGRWISHYAVCTCPFCQWSPLEEGRCVPTAFRERWVPVECHHLLFGWSLRNIRILLPSRCECRPFCGE